MLDVLQDWLLVTIAAASWGMVVGAGVAEGIKQLHIAWKGYKPLDQTTMVAGSLVSLVVVTWFLLDAGAPTIVVVTAGIPAVFVPEVFYDFIHNKITKRGA